MENTVTLLWVAMVVLAAIGRFGHVSWALLAAGLVLAAFVGLFLIGAAFMAARRYLFGA